MSAKPIPILVTGRTEIIGRMVRDHMLPEYDVIQIALIRSIKDELPFLLKGSAPPNPSSTSGSGNWSSPPQALLLGGGYQDRDVEELVELTKNTDGAMEIPWLRVDVRKTQGPPPSAEPTEEQAAAYGKVITQRMKDALNKLNEEGKLGPGNGGIHLV